MNALIRILGLVILGLVSLTDSAMATPNRAIMDDIPNVSNANYANGNMRGGAWYIDVYDDSTGTEWLDIVVFCLEVNETITLGGTEYDISSVTNYAENGGAGGATDNKDPISKATAWLYRNAVNLRGLYTITDNWDEVQWAIWILEDEVADYTKVVGGADKNLVKDLVDTAISEAGSGDYEGSLVVVYNLVAKGVAPIEHRQSMLGWHDDTGPGNPVPEPAALLLLGGGLLGFAGLRRRHRAG